MGVSGDARGRRQAAMAATIALYAAHTVLLAAGAVTGLWDPGYLAPSSWAALTVQFGLGALVWIACRRRGRSATLVVAIAVASATAILLGLAASWGCGRGAAPGWSEVAATLGLFLGGSEPPCGAPATPAWQTARLAAMLAVGTGAVGVVGVVFRGQVDRVAARLARSTAVVVGPTPPLDHTVAALKASLPRGVRLIVLDDARGAAPERGVSVLTADPTRVDEMRPLVRRRGRSVLRSVHLMDESAARNEQILAVFGALESGARRRAGAPAFAHVRIDDVWQAEHWRRLRVGHPGPLIGDAFSLPEATAIALLDRIQDAGCDVVVVAGDRSLALALCAELARRQREDRARVASGDRARPELVLLGPGAGETALAQATLQLRFGNEPVPVTADERDLDMRSLGDAVRSAQQPALILLDAPHAATASSFAGSLPDLIVLARDDRIRGVSATAEMEKLFLFGPVSDPGRGMWERIARIAHENYITKNGLDPTKPARRPWGQLEDFHRETNLRLIMTALGSAVSLGRSWRAEKGDAPRFSPSEIEIAARVEHESWVDHHIAHGWRLGPHSSRTHPLLVPWDALAEENRDWTRGSVRSAWDLLATAGYRAHPDPAPERAFARRGTVTASRRNAPWTWLTPTGDEMSADAGDWVVSDGEAEWSVEDGRFRDTYVHVSADTWRRTGVVHARRAVIGERIDSLEGPEIARGVDDWVVQGSAGERWIVPGAHFARVYAPTNERWT